MVKVLKAKKGEVELCSIDDLRDHLRDRKAFTKIRKNISVIRRADSKKDLVAKRDLMANITDDARSRLNSFHEYVSVLLI